MSTSAVEARALHKAWPRGKTPFVALHALDLTIPRGVTYGLVGPNGAGKTTFIKLVLSVARATAGEVRVLGGSPDDTAVRARIGYLPENLHLPPAWTPLAFLASIARLKRCAVDSQALLGRVGLAANATQTIGTFSKGMRQRLGLAAALVGAPELLVLDEPTDGIDPLGRVDVRRLLLEEKAKGTTVLLNSHLLSETEKVCDRVGILSGGRLVKDGTLAELTGASGYEVRIASPVALAGLPFVERAGVLHFASDDVLVLNQALDGLRRRGGVITGLQRRTLSLEDVLAEVAR